MLCVHVRLIFISGNSKDDEMRVNSYLDLPLKGSNLCMCLKLLFSWATCKGCHITKFHMLGGLNNRNSFSHNSGGQTSKIKVLESPVFPEASSLLALQTAAILLCPQVMFPLCEHVLPVSLYMSKFIFLLGTPIVLN